MDKKFITTDENGFVTHIFCSVCDGKSPINFANPYKYSNREWAHNGHCDICGKGFSVWYDEKNIFSNTNFDGQISRISIRDAKYDPQVNVKFVYPIHIPKTHKDVPEKARKSHEEGIICLNVNANNAAVTMFRRSLQKICVDKGAKEDEYLVEQIKILPKDLEKHATELCKWLNRCVGLLVKAGSPLAEACDLHHLPINAVFCCRPSSYERITCLGIGFVLRCFQHLA